MGYNEFKCDVERSYEEKSISIKPILSFDVKPVYIWIFFLYGLPLRERSFIRLKGFILIMLKVFISGLTL